MITLSIATPSDADQLCGLLSQLFAQEAEFTPHKPTQMRGLTAILGDAEIGHILVARHAGKLVGMVSLLYTISTALGARVAWVEDMVVDHRHRHQGIGSLLLDHAIAFARQQQCARLTLLTDHHNQAAQGFYARHGFVSSPMIPLRRML